jgi:hypothetical protein
LGLKSLMVFDKNELTSNSLLHIVFNTNWYDNLNLEFNIILVSFPV